MDGNHIIRMLDEFIQNDKPDNLLKVLSRIPIEELENEISDKLLRILISRAVELNRKECIKIILKTWDDTEINSDNEVNTLIRLLFMKQLSDHQVAAVIRIMSEYTFVDILESLINSDSDVEIYYVCQRAYDIYSNISILDLEEIQKTIEELDSESIGSSRMVYDFITDKISEKSNFSTVPIWVKNYMEFDSLPTNDELLELLPSQFQYEESYNIPNDEIDLYVDKLTEGLDNFGIGFDDIESSRDQIRDILINGSLSERKILLDPLFEKESQDTMMENILVFRILGPSNPLVETIIDANDESEKYGGYRMFTCTCYDAEDPETGVFLEESPTMWFTGSCEECLSRIKSVHHSVRRPDPLGGWQGCFCSWECVRNSLRDGDALQFSVIDEFEKSILRFGIQDRIDFGIDQ